MTVFRPFRPRDGFGGVTRGDALASLALAPGFHISRLWRLFHPLALLLMVITMQLQLMRLLLMTLFVCVLGFPTARAQETRKIVKDGIEIEFTIVPAGSKSKTALLAGEDATFRLKLREDSDIRREACRMDRATRETRITGSGSVSR